jgi:Na+-transporting methylmalonyl-CoA/oxaloacetate decarboxylase gamma subunit
MRRIEKPGLRGMAILGAVLTALALVLWGCSRLPKEPVVDTAAVEAARQETEAAELAVAEAARQEAVAAELAAAEAARQETEAAELAAAEAVRQEAVAAELAVAEATVAEAALQTYPAPDESLEPGENIGRETTGVREDMLITTATETAGTSGEPSGAPAADSGGRRFSMGLLNLALGAGSFVQKDWGGGLAMIAGYAAAGGLIAWELTLIYEDPLAGIPGAVGLGVAASAAIFGFVRPFFFNRNRPEAIQAKRVNFSVVPGDRGAAGVRVSYTLQY